MPATETLSPHLWTPEETAQRLGVNVRTLSNWRCSQRYPLPYVRIGGKSIRYRPADVAKFIEQNIVTPGSAE